MPHLTPPPFRPRLGTAVAAAVGMALASMAAWADESAPDSLEAIVVTANRREQNALDVPYNISTVSGHELETAGATSLVDMARLLPGVTIPDVGSRANNSNSLIIIRGLNVNDPVGSSYLPWGSVPMVSTYIDDVPLYVDLRLDDIERVEVLRGPQGTLYGSGAVGGTIKMQHNAPDLAHFSALAAAEVSHTDHASEPSYAAHFVINEPLSDKLGLRMSGGYRKDAGFINAVAATVFGPNMQPVLADPASPLTSPQLLAPINHVDDAHSDTLRIAALWKAAPGWDANFAYQRQDNSSSGFSHETQGYAYETAALAPQEPDHRQVDLESMTWTGDVGFATFTSSTSYSKDKDDNTYDESEFLLNFNAPLVYGSYPRPTSFFFDTHQDDSFTQEFRLTSKEGGAWDYTAGAFFQRQTQHLFQRESIPGFAAWSELPGSADAANAALAQMGITANYANFGDFLQQYYGGTRPSALSPTDTMFGYTRLSQFKDRALFGELTRHLTDKWQVTGGARVFWQEFHQSLDQVIPYEGPINSTLPYPQNLTDAMGTTIADRTQGFHDHTFKLNSSYALEDSTRVYATFSQGFRHGGVNAVPVGGCLYCESNSVVPYRSDTVDNYEVGAKGTLGGHLRYSAAVYRVNWDDIQIQTFGQSGDPVVVNGKTARSQGIELEAQARLGGGWSANFGYGLTDAELTQDFSVVDVVAHAFVPSTVLVSGFAGNRLPNVPRQTLTGEVNYSAPLRADLDFDAHLNAAYRSDVVTEINSLVPGYKALGGFTTLNGSVGLGFGPSWHARLFVNNIGNIRGIVSAGQLFRNDPDPRYNTEYPTRPRTIGLGVDYTFD
jgi:outer membrane receptor protein involved in Fe transport